MAPRARPASPKLAPLRLRAELARTLATLERQIDVGISHAVLSPEEIHGIHRELRRLASGLAVWGHLVPTNQAEVVRQTGQRIRRLSRLVGRARDRDVTTGLLAPGGRPRANGELEPWHEFLGRLRDDTHTGRELLRAFLRTERQAGLFDRVEALLGLAPRPDAHRGLHRILADERRRRQGRVRKAHRKARRDPTSERLHRLRIRIRQWRHLSTLEVAARATESRPPPSWQRLQDRLGRLHDLDVALATIPEELADSEPARRLSTKRRELRRTVRAAIERIAERPRRVAALAGVGGGL